MTNKFIVMDVQVDAAEAPDRVVTAYLKLRSMAGIEFWALVTKWREVFPYALPSGLPNLENNPNQIIGKMIKAELNFVNLNRFERNKSGKKIYQKPNARSSDETEICGVVIKKTKLGNADEVTIDCGILIDLNVAAGSRLKVGDSVSVMGILNCNLSSLSN